MIKILYLEDNKFDIDLTIMEIEKSIPDCTIKIARTIKEANTHLGENSDFDAAILDLNLPDGNGIDALMAIRRQQFPIAVIILTGSGNEEAAIAALKAGADDYLTKNEGYLKRLPGMIEAAIENFRKNLEKTLKPLKVLYIEWNKPDIEFTERHMQKYAPHIQIRNVPTAAEALTLLPDTNDNCCPFDVLLMDYRLPGLNAIDVIKIIRQERKLCIPIVLVSGHGSEDIAVQALKLGANEYLVKRENYLYRLPSLLTSAFQRSELEKQQAALRESEAKYRLLAENAGDVIFILNMDFKYKYVSPAVKALRGFEVEEALKQNLTQVLTPNSLKLAQKVISDFIPEKGKELLTKLPPQVVELEMLKKDGGTVWTEVKVSVVTDENNIPVGIQGVTRDISKRKEAQEALLKSREEYRSFFEDDLTGDFISTVDGKLLNCNPAYLRMLGFESKEQALNYDLNKLFESEPDAIEMIELVKKNNRLISYEHDLKRVDGKIIHTIANIIGSFDEKGNLETLKGYIIDDTERKKASEEIRKLSRAIEQSPSSIVITDLKGNIEYTNPIFSEKTGYSFEEAKGKNPRILKSGNIPNDVYVELWETISSGNVWIGEFLNKRKDGTLFWESASISPVKNEKGETTHYLAVKEDITDKKKYEEELIVARDQAQESDRLKSAFLATMSHELRTPLNAIIGFSSLVDEHTQKPEVIRYSKIINKSGNHLLNIIEDIFTVSMLQTGQSKVIIEEFDLSDFFRSLVQYSKMELKNKNKLLLQIETQPHIINTKIRIKTDKTKTYQVLINLAKNAIEYSDTGQIEIGYTINENEIIFFVKDNGIGIPADKLEIIFERFRRLDHSNAQLHGGVGLGLAICAEIANLLKGKIWVESEEGKGSTFYFSLKDVIVTDHVKINVEKRLENIPDLSDKTILVVEDDDINYLLIENYILRTNAKIIWAKSGEESIEKCKANPNISLVLMDIRMQGIDGYEAANQIKKFRPNLIIIAQTAYALRSDYVKALHSKCDDYISKPILIKPFMELLKKHLA